MGQVSHRKIRTIDEGELIKYSRKWAERKTIFVIGPNRYGSMKVVSRTPFRYGGKIVNRHYTDTRRVGWGKLVTKVAEENYIPFRNIRYNN